MIAILGATGYVGKSLAREFISRGKKELVLFARETGALLNEPWPSALRVEKLQDFEASDFDLVINAVGAGDPARVASMGAEILDITQRWDDAVLSSMTSCTHYVFLSSGAIYGEGFDRPAERTDMLNIPVNDIAKIPPYTIAKLYAEAKHRARPNQAILDIRIFGYADEAINPTGKFFLSELIRSVVQGTPFYTSTDDMVRDYAGRQELADLILSWQSAGAPNGAADLYTLDPVSKNRLLAMAEERHGLKIVRSQSSFANPTGRKNIYASANRAAAAFGYSPKRSAFDVVAQVLASASAPKN